MVAGASLFLVLSACLVVRGAALRKAAEESTDDKDGCLKNANGWLPDNGASLCGAGRFEEARQAVTCVQKAYDPLYRSGGLNWGKEQSVSKSFEVCTARGFNWAVALAHTQCLQQAWKSGEQARAGCGIEASQITAYTDCLAKANGWLLNDGVEPCLAGGYDAVARQATCVQQAYEPLYLRSGLNWDKPVSVAKAAEVCTFRGDDAKNSLAHTRCLTAAWSLGEQARDGCKTDAKNVDAYANCLTQGKEWLPGQVVKLCMSEQYVQAVQWAGCVAKAYMPLYERSGLDWAKDASITKATQVCEERYMLEDVALAHTRCLVVAWSIGDKAREGCGVDASKLDKYTGCITAGKGWLPDNGAEKCTAGLYHEVAKMRVCVEKAYMPLYEKSGLDWNKDLSTKKAFEVCTVHGYDADKAVAQTRCLQQAWSLGEKAREGCSNVGSDSVAYQDCLKQGKSWLPDGGVALCTAGNYGEVTRQSACVQKAYSPLYDRSGLNWNQQQSNERAFDVCLLRGNDADAALAHTRCLVPAWSLGDKARAGCDVEVSKVPAYTDCLIRGKEWLPGGGIEPCLAGQYEKVALSSACTQKAYLPLYDRSGLNWDKQASATKAFEICESRGNDADQALAHARCFVLAHSMGTKAQEGCGLDVAKLPQYSDCISQGKGWLPDSGEALCLAGRYDEVARQSACVQKAYSPLYDRSGLNWDKQAAATRAFQVCAQRGNDADLALAHTRCLVAAWSVGDKARDGCGADAAKLPGYTDCIIQAKGWLPDSGVELCTAGKFSEVKLHSACIQQAFGPLYDRTGLNWAKEPATTKAAEVCALRRNDPEISLAHTRCLQEVWSLGDKAKEGCANSSPTVLVQYTSCIKEAKGWLPDNGVALCTAGKFDRMAQEAACITAAYDPFYKRQGGLDWSKPAATAKAAELCGTYNQDPAVSLVHAKCLVSVWSSEASRARCASCIANATAWLPSSRSLCADGAFEALARRIACVENVSTILRAGPSSRQDAVETCIQAKFNKGEATTFATCVVAAGGGAGKTLGVLGLLNVTKCVESAFREKYHCTGLVFGPAPNARGIAFVVDISSSMDSTRGGVTRLEFVKKELGKAIGELQANQGFTVLAFNSGVSSLPGGLLLADETNKSKAVAWASSLRATGGTNFEAALKQAIAVKGVDTVFLLSDGEPSEGCTKLPCMPTGGLPVHTTLFMPGPETDERIRARELMQGIAEATGGAFREPFL